jgi:hypothetical protein
LTHSSSASAADFARAFTGIASAIAFRRRTCCVIHGSSHSSSSRARAAGGFSGRARAIAAFSKSCCLIQRSTESSSSARLRK